MDGIDFQEEHGQPRGGNAVYATPEAVLKHRECAKDCGVVEVEVSLVGWIYNPNPEGKTYSREEVEAELAKRDAEMRKSAAELVDALCDQLVVVPSTKGREELISLVVEDRKRRKRESRQR